MQQELKSELTKQIIIDKAFNLFYENGFKTTSIDRIMNATNLTKGAFYHHYKNKKELGLEVIALKLQKRVYDSMILPLYETGDALKILETTFLERIKSFPVYDKQHGCPMNNFINEIGDFETAYQTALKNIIENWKSALATLIERGQDEKSINSNISSQAVAVYLISAFEGIRGIRKLYDNDLILDEYIIGLSVYLKQLEA
ncbi:TetR/AcrR family transcriptional regulator [Arenibacter sp. TNZ]|jgi:AcrR family transcriptional regulator|uniref:TetR/AcrR family transcriptional regulator n=1 Tax=Arenibacter TaxID=178469 RepID=UPI000CD4699C|nr:MULTISPECIES: TetR/AcrR family transcriptional regulator [Arenibacter]MCM4172767.1 TetR/AcrR family transcriptional regulator [Arenibacter sp. TNZ]